MVSAVLDHLVVAAATLEQGEKYLERRIGVRPQRGGQHLAMGTHNSLLKLGERLYLELIAIDPRTPAPRRARWFELDSPALQSALADAPRLIHWAVRGTDIDAARRALPLDPGPIQTMTRDAFQWRITVPDDGSLPAGGVLPALIQWLGTRHPADLLPDAGLGLVAFAAAHPEPGLLRRAVASLGLGEAIKISYGSQPRLSVLLQTSAGRVAL